MTADGADMAPSADDDKSHAERVEEAGRPTLKSLLIYFLPLSPMNPSPATWCVGLVPAALHLVFFSAGAPPPFWLRHALLGGAAGDAKLDWRPAWLQALDCGERVVLFVVHALVAMLHLQIASFMKSEQGAAMMTEARALARTDAPKGAAAYDALQWPPGPSIAAPARYMRFHTLLDALPLGLLALGLPDLAFLAMLVEKAGGLVDHLHMYGGTLTERLRTTYPVMAALCVRLSLLCALRAQPSAYGVPSSAPLDALAHVAGAALLGVLVRPLGWAACGARPASRGRPGRTQTPWQKKA